ncbi:MAG: hypothetical protein IJA19_03430 [Clostridia bacterium]|nr:hypothetical protein [Clostridia bacterium]
MKKLSVLLVAVILMLSLFGCGNGEQLARETAEGFLSAYCELDIQKMMGFVDDTSKLPDDVKDFSMEKIMGEFPEELKAYTGEFEKVVNVFFDKAKEKMSYSIKESAEIEGGYEFVVDIIQADFENSEFEDKLTESLSTEKATEIVNELLSSGAITYQSTQEEIYNALVPKVVSIMEEVVNGLEIATKTEQGTVVVIEKDGQWFVSADKTNIEY